MLAHALLLIGGFGALYFGAEWLVRGAARISAILGVSPVVVGLTIVAVGTSAPELVVCVFATLDGDGDLVVGNILGSNLANVGLILGITALIRPIAVASRVITREIPIMVALTILIYPIVMDLEVTRGEGLLMLGLLALYIAFTFASTGPEMKAILGEVEELTHVEVQGAEGEGATEERVQLTDVGLVFAGGLGLVAGGQAIVRGAQYLAEAFGAPELLIGLTIVAIGTSLPELVTSVVAAARQEVDIAVGNIVGSNIFNLTAVLGGTAVAGPFAVPRGVLGRELAAVLVISALVLPFASSGARIRRAEGVFLVAAYVGLTLWLALR